LRVKWLSFRAETLSSFLWVRSQKDDSSTRFHQINNQEFFIFDFSLSLSKEGKSFEKRLGKMNSHLENEENKKKERFIDRGKFNILLF